MKDDDSFRLLHSDTAGLWLAILVAALLLWPFVVRAQDSRFTLDLGIGQTRGTAAPDGQFYQKEHHNSLRMIDNVSAIGLTYKATEDWSFGFHTANLGTFEIHAQAFTCPADDCSKADRTKDSNRAECKGKFSDNCMYSWVSNGGARGFTFDTAYTLARWRGVALDARAAAFLHKVYWKAVVENTDCRDAGCWRYAFNQSSGYQIRPVLGAGVSYSPEWAKGGSVIITWDRFFDIAKHNEVTAGFKGDIDRTMIWIRAPL